MIKQVITKSPLLNCSSSLCIAFFFYFFSFFWVTAVELEHIFRWILTKFIENEWFFLKKKLYTKKYIRLENPSVDQISFWPVERQVYFYIIIEVCFSFHGFSMMINSNVGIGQYSITRYRCEWNSLENGIDYIFFCRCCCCHCVWFSNGMCLRFLSVYLSQNYVIFTLSDFAQAIFMRKTEKKVGVIFWKYNICRFSIFTDSSSLNISVFKTWLHSIMLQFSWMSWTFCFFSKLWCVQ